jgi:L-asparaginase
MGQVADGSSGPVTRRPRVAVIFMGGTISMLPDPETGAAVPALDGAAILARVPGLSRLAGLEPIDWGRVPASHLRFAQLLDVAATIGRAATQVDGVVVVQGTDVLEETAFAWDLLYHEHAPVVVVGAMRNAGEPDYDGPANLTDAVRVAADPRLRGSGVLVVMAGSILPADDVTKTHSLALDTFQALNSGPLGHVVDGRVGLERKRGPRRSIAVVPDQAADVALLTAAVSMDGSLLRAATRSGVAGVVVEATGSGNSDPDLLAAAAEAMAVGVEVALATRCASGPVGPFYGFPGGGRSWREAGALLAGTLSGPKARVALALGLGARLDHAQLRGLLAGDPGTAAATGRP